MKKIYAVYYTDPYETKEYKLFTSRKKALNFIYEQGIYALENNKIWVNLSDAEKYSYLAKRKEEFLKSKDTHFHGQGFKYFYIKTKEVL